MRLWSLHPKYLDTKGLVACWREGLLARKVLLGETRGYRNHPQLDRFKATPVPIIFIDTYLRAIYEEATRRAYTFDHTKIASQATRKKLAVTDGQLRYEFRLLKTKLLVRDQAKLHSIADMGHLLAHPLFLVIQGKIESWERVKTDLA